MRKQYLGIALLVLLGSVAPSLAAADLPRHVDPAELVAEKPYPVNLIYLYHLFFGSVVSERFSEAPSWLKLALEVYASEDVKAVMDRLNQLLGSEVLSLNSTSLRIDAAFLQLRRMNAAEVKLLVTEAIKYLKEANVTIGSVEDIQRQLAKLLGASPDPMLEDSASVRQLIESYRKILAGLLDSADRLDYQIIEGEFVPTSISISLNVSEALVGSGFTVMGRLIRVDGSPLSGRVADLRIDGLTVDRAFTESDGGFSANLTTPYMYKKEVIVTAEFWPSSLESGSLLPSFSNEEHLALIYYTPSIALTVPYVAYPGKEITVAGSLSFSGTGLGGFSVRVYCLSGVYSAVTSASGDWSVVVPVPADSRQGIEWIFVESLASGVYGPSSRSSSLAVVRLPSSVSVDAPYWAASATKVKVSGRATVGDQLLSNAVIRVVGGVGESSTRTDSSGQFSAMVDFPSPLLTNSYTYTVVATPAEPWIRGASSEGSIFIVNVYTLIGGPSLAFLGVVYGSSVLRRRKTDGVEPLEDALKPVVYTPEPVEDAPAMVAEPANLGDHYHNALLLVGGYTGVYSAASQTLKEYYTAVRSLLPGGAAEAFSQITVLYERVLYGVPIVLDLIDAERLYNLIREALRYEK